ncbi:MAG: hypothetical protein SGPRY_011174 [Prymnesium sp.]
MAGQCRICHEEDGRAMISPCGCSGSMRHVHLSCLLEWLHHAHGSSLASPLVCRVCQQPYSLVVPGVWRYARAKLSSLWTGRSRVLSSLVSTLSHFLTALDCPHLHCAWLRLALAALTLQLCVWEGQLLMLLGFSLLRVLMRLDALLDEIVIPTSLLHSFYVLMPPLCEVAPAVIGLLPRTAHGTKHLPPPRPASRLLCSALRRLPHLPLPAACAEGSPPPPRHMLDELGAPFFALDMSSLCQRLVLTASMLGEGIADTFSAGIALSRFLWQCGKMVPVAVLQDAAFGSLKRYL